MVDTLHHLSLQILQANNHNGIAHMKGERTGWLVVPWLTANEGMFGQAASGHRHSHIAYRSESISSHTWPSTITLSDEKQVKQWHHSTSIWIDCLLSCNEQPWGTLCKEHQEEANLLSLISNNICYVKWILVNNVCKNFSKFCNQSSVSRKQLPRAVAQQCKSSSEHGGKNL